MTADYNDRFDVMRENLHKGVPLPTTIFNIMTGLHISQKLACELCYNTTRSRIRTYLRKELEQPETIPIDSVITLMPDNMWRYFKLNCCVFADKYNYPATYNIGNSKKSAKPLSHISLDYIRFLNNWYNLRGIIYNDSNCHGLYIDKSEVSNDETGMNFLLSKADELAEMYGYKTAEQFFEAKLLYPEINKITLDDVI